MPGEFSVLPRRYVPAALLAGGAALCIAFGLSRCGTRASAPPALMLSVTPLPHRPSAPWSAQDHYRLLNLVESHFAPILQSPQNGFVMLDADGRVLYDHRGSQSRTPASTLKVLTAATAMRVLGPQYRFLTRIAALEQIDDDTLDGDLYVIGGGDPVLSSHDIHNGIAALRAAGLRHILGHVVIDSSAFLGPEQNPHWAPDDLNLDYAAGTNALSLDGDIEVFRVTPMLPGQPAQVHLEPRSATAQIFGSIITGSSGSGGTVHIDHQQGTTIYRLSGSIDAGAEQRFPIPVGNVSEHVAGVTDAIVHAYGITTAGPARVDAAPLGAQTLWQHRSPPLQQIVHHMLVVSDNHVAEQLLRTIAASQGHRGVESAGIAVESAFLNQLGVPDKGLRLYDGSGLSPGNRIAPRSLATVIADAELVPGRPLIVDLPRVGIEGTVKGHTLKSSLGRVRAKSGHISGVDGLVGVIDTKHHGAVAFAFITNDADDGTVEDAEDAIFDGMMQF